MRLDASSRVGYTACVSHGTRDPNAEQAKVAPGPRWSDWALLSVCLIFVAMGAFILPGKFDVGMVTIAFFGFCALAPVTTILRKRRDRRTRPLRAAVVGGVRIRPSRAKAAALGGGLLVLGATLIAFGGSYPLPFRVVSWFIAGVGAAFTALVLLGIIPVGHLMFTPRGLTVGHRRFTVTVAWDDIVAWDSADFNDNPLLRIWLRDGAEPLVEPPSFSGRAQRDLASSQAWMGAPVAIMTSMYALDLPLVVKAIERYVQEPESRAELDSSRLLQG